MGYFLTGGRFCFVVFLSSGSSISVTDKGVYFYALPFFLTVSLLINSSRSSSIAIIDLSFFSYCTYYY